MKRIVIASTTNYIFDILKKKKKFFKKCKILKRKNDLNYRNLKKIKADLIFFPHWNWIIKNKIYKNFNCIGFHSSPLPYGRGGSPIQNMIDKGFKSTSICAIKINGDLDAGPIYLSKKISISGRAENIFKRINKVIANNIIYLSKKLPKPKPQRGEIYYFRRRNPKMSLLPNKININKLYNHIRMLDLDEKNFPKAFLYSNGFKITFSHAALEKNKTITAKAIIKKI